MKQITSNAELIIGEHYWCREKDKSQVISLQQCKALTDKVINTISGWKYLGCRIWAEDHNNQALERWDIVGPIPEMTISVFNDICLPY